MQKQSKDPWTDPDPQPGDFDEYLAEIDPRDVQIVEGSPGARVVYIGNEDPNEWVMRRREAEARNGATPAPRGDRAKR